MFASLSLCVRIFEVIMTTLLEDFLEKTISVLTNDGRNVVGTLQVRAFDLQTDDISLQDE